MNSRLFTGDYNDEEEKIEIKLSHIYEHRKYPRNLR